MHSLLLGAALSVLAACGASPTAPASETKVVGGHAASNRPFIAGLVERDTNFSVCGGTFVSKAVVLTAAHCVAEGWQGLRVVGGDPINKALGADKTAAATKVVIHERYNAKGHDNDLALVFLDSAELDHFSAPVETANLSDDMVAPEKLGAAVVAGWGAVRAGGQYPDELREVTVPIVDVAKCKSAGGQYDSVSQRQICAGDWEHGGIDSCQGDSGGPLFVEHSGGTELIGVVSWGDGCAAKHKPGVYTRVAAFRDWIQSAMAKAQAEER